MGFHQDKDEQTIEAPVVSVSLGDTAIFRGAVCLARTPPGPSGWLQET